MIRQLKNKKHFLNIWETIYGSLDVPFAEWCGKKGSQGNIVYILMNNVKHADFDYTLKILHSCSASLLNVS